MQEILIGDVEIISMLIFSSPSVSKTLRCNARVAAHSRTHDRDFADPVVGQDALADAKRLDRLGRLL